MRRLLPTGLGARLLLHFACFSLLYIALVLGLAEQLPQGRQEFDRLRTQAALDLVRQRDDLSPLSDEQIIQLCAPFGVELSPQGETLALQQHHVVHLTVRPSHGLILMSHWEAVKLALIAFAITALTSAVAMTLLYANRLLTQLRKAAAQLDPDLPDATRYGEIGPALEALSQLATTTRRRQSELEAQIALIAADNRHRDEILQRVRDELQPEVNRIVELIQTFPPSQRLRRQGSRLATLLSDLYDVETPFLRVERVRLDLRECAEQALTSLAAGSLVSLEATSQPLWTEADRLRIEQVLINLLNNALKASPANTPVTLSLVRDGQEIVLRVSDRGPGMSAQQIHSLGEEAHGSARPLTEQSGDPWKSHGLGLVICRRLLELHQARLHITSEPNQGTCVEVRFRADCTESA